MALLDDIWRWINEADAEKNKAEIFLLAGVAGSGKSAIAHSVAQRSHKDGLLASSFFFNRDIPERRVPQRLFSTLAHDLATLTKGVEEHIGHSLAKDRSLASASQSRQFDELILKPFIRHHINRPIVIVIDALDEGCDSETIAILRDEVPKLPGTFRIFITTRAKDEIMTDLLEMDHVQTRVIDIHGTPNRADIFTTGCDMSHHGND
jgi:ABC-type dipeptide/oligopeptide/nickel transport system ATPase component